MMNQFQREKSTMSYDNYECNCFGEVKTELQFFLTKQRAPDARTASMTNLPHLTHLPNSQLKNSFKRSLRRTNTDLGDSSRRDRQGSQNEEGCSLKDSFESAGEREGNEIAGTPATNAKVLENSGSSNEESSRVPNTPTRTPVFLKTASCHNILQAAQNPLLTSFTPSPTRNDPPTNSPPTPLRLNPHPLPPPPPQINLLHPPHAAPSFTFHLSPPQPQKPQQHKPNIFLSLKQIKQETSVRLMTSTVKEMTSIEEQSEIDRSMSRLDRLKTPRTNCKDLKGFTGKEDTFKSSLRYDTNKLKLDIAKTKTDTLKSIIDTGKSKIDTCKSRIDPAKSKIDQPNRSRIQTKKSLMGEGAKHRLTSHRLKDNRTGLKKMDDVEEIHSLPDEDEREDSDQESVVLGRLHEYGSMVDPRMDEASSSPTLTSKLISLKTQPSSTVGKSYLRSFEFMHDRPFK